MKYMLPRGIKLHQFTPCSYKSMNKCTRLNSSILFLRTLHLALTNS